MSAIIYTPEILQLIPKKSEDISVQKFDNGDYLLTHKVHKYRMKINDITNILLKLVDGKKNVAQLSYEISNIKQKTITGNEVYDVLYNQLGKFQVIENDLHKVEPLSKPDYLKLSFRLISKEKLTPLIKPLTFLFKNQVFYTTLIIMLLVILFIGYSNEWTKAYDLFQGKDWFYLLVISFSTVFFHELGHAAACKKHGGNYGEIGFGFYLLSPVLYADVSDIWKLPVTKRIIVSLAGIYMQILIGFAFGCLYLYTHNYFYLGLMTSVTGASILYNLNPFLRTDGYWILSDMLRISNLRKKSNNYFIECIKSIPNKNPFKNLKTNELFFILYGLISNTFIYAFIGIAFYYNSYALFNFPIETYKVIFEYINYSKVIDIESIKKIALSFLFYFTLYRLLKTYLSKNYESKKQIFTDAMMVVLASIYFLSAVGKLISYDNFIIKSKQYPFYFDGVTYIIIGVEFLIAFGFISFRYIKISAKLSALFLLIITSLYVYTYYKLNIKECDCFGHFSFLNSNNIWTTLTKNFILFALPFYYLKINKSINFKAKRSLIALGVIFLITFESFLLENFAGRQLALSYKDKSINSITRIHLSSEIEKADYIFIFSPECPHCIELIPELNKIHKKINLIGIVKKKNYESNSVLEKVEFKTLFWKKKDLKRITSIVSTLITVKNKIIVDVCYPDKKIIENLGASRKSFKE
jgi:thiol-disulfide isomerase/thioredoxin